MTSDSRTSSRPEVIQRIAGLELKARQIVEGSISGLHRSPFHGFSVEFAEHRQYVPGDDVRFLDWKVFGKTDRLTIKRYEEETNLDAHLVVDTSLSMAYDDRDGALPSKLEYATWAAAALAWLITRQRDAAGLVLFDDRIRTTLPAQSNEAHLGHLFAALETARPHGKTGMGRALAEVGEAIRRRGLVILFSDLLDEEEAVLQGLEHLRRRGHEVLLFHLLARDEVEFPFQRLTRFEGLEEEVGRIVDPPSLRTAYLEEVRSFRSRLRRACMGSRIDLVELDTGQDLGVVLATFLARREARRARRG